MAEALLRHFGGERFDVHSAGSIPSGIHPMTLRALAEVGIDAGHQHSKHWDIYLNEPPFDYVVAVCEPAAQNCPIAPLKGRRLAWPVEDAVGTLGTDEEQMREFRRVRDQVSERVRQFVREMESKATRP
jgi:arsenate reductase